MNIPTGPPGVEFDILANYNPLPEGELYTRPASAKSVSAKKATAGPAAVRRGKR
jgi:hypothetical protein